MSDLKTRADALLSKLTQMRDELNLKVHLGKAEAKEEWEELEKKWQEVKAKGKLVEGKVDESAKNVSSAMEHALEELKSGYERIRDLLK